MRKVFLAGAAALSAALALAAPGHAQGEGTITGRIDWGIWVDADGCMHWWADGGLEGYMVTRLNPKTGRPLCLVATTCLREDVDTLFAPGSTGLAPAARERLRRFFQRAGAFSYAVYGHTSAVSDRDADAARAQRQANAVAQAGVGAGAVIDRVAVVGKSTQLDRTIEVVCYRYPE